MSLSPLQTTLSTREPVLQAQEALARELSEELGIRAEVIRRLTRQADVTPWRPGCRRDRPMTAAHVIAREGLEA